MTEEFLRTGRLWLRGALSETDLVRYDQLCEPGMVRPGARIDAAVMHDNGDPLSRLVTGFSPGSRAVRAVAFNKSTDANWGVAWHQDRIIAVEDRHDRSGFVNWSRKDGQWHCEAPVDVLSQMLFVRLHLDPAGPESGPMEIALESHRSGLVLGPVCDRLAATYPTELCLAERGDVLILHMLILHRSRPASRPSARRTLRVDFTNLSLPPPLNWAV